MSGRRAVTAAALALAALAPPAGAHVQVTPKEVAPSDPVVFTVLVPNERDNPTTRVEMEVPDGVVPFSFEQVPGWQRETSAAVDGAVESVAWTGELPEGGFVRFAFLASTPDAPGTLTFRTVQTYADGTEAAWVGPPDSDEPAPTVEVSATAGRANAGGEGPDDEEVSTAEAGAPESEPATAVEAPTTTAPPETAPPTASEAAAATEDDGDGSTLAWIGVALGALGLAAGAAALAIVLRRRPGRAGGGTDTW